MNFLISKEKIPRSFEKSDGEFNFAILETFHTVHFHAFLFNAVITFETFDTAKISNRVRPHCVFCLKNSVNWAKLSFSLDETQLSSLNSYQHAHFPSILVTTVWTLANSVSCTARTGFVHLVSSSFQSPTLLSFIEPCSLYSVADDSLPTFHWQRSGFRWLKKHEDWRRRRIIHIRRTQRETERRAEWRENEKKKEETTNFTANVHKILRAWSIVIECYAVARCSTTQKDKFVPWNTLGELSRRCYFPPKRAPEFQHNVFSRIQTADPKNFWLTSQISVDGGRERESWKAFWTPHSSWSKCCRNEYIVSLS